MPEKMIVPFLPKPRRLHGGGRAAKLARARPVQPRAPYIVRNFPIMRILDEEGLQLIERNADTILQEVGMEFRGDPEVLDIFRAAGADVQGERVRFERGMCRKIIQASAPRAFDQRARNRANDIHIGGASAVFTPAGGAPFVHDIERGRRYGSHEDYLNLLKIAQTLPCIHTASGGICELVDVPVPQRHLHTVYAQFRYTDRAIKGVVRSPQAAIDTLEMAKLVFGDEFLQSNCCIYSGVNTNSPLVFDVTMMAALKIYARHRQAVLVSAYVLGGAMGPLGVAGSLSQQLAETLGGLALIQLISPGAPCAMGCFIGTVSMQTGAPAFGTPESLRGITIAAELARRLGVPASCAGGAVTASKIPDAQAATESALTLQASFFAGINYISHAVGWLEGGLSAGYEKMIIDADLCSALQGFAQPLDVSEDGQALDAVREVGPGSHYLGCANTQRNFETAHWRPLVADSGTYEQWQAEGGRDAAVRANAIWKKMLGEYEAPPIDPGVDEALRTYRDRRLREIQGGT
ncbi:MAG: trimethylamine methyltransferase family protein [Alphaproteobacteria bacterium]|nr:trimethylamine methyltransferase family protein [Alphaproteobacteria bacterium]